MTENMKKDFVSKPPVSETVKNSAANASGESVLASVSRVIDTMRLSPDQEEKVLNAKAEAEKQWESARKLEAAKQAAARIEAAKQEAARIEAAKQEAARIEAAKKEAAMQQAAAIKQDIEQKAELTNTLEHVVKHEHTEKPAAEAADTAPAAEEPVVAEPVVEPAPETPVIEQPVVAEPVAQATAETPVSEQPAAEEPAVEQSAPETPVVEQPAAEEPAAEQTAIEEPAEEAAATSEEAAEFVSDPHTAVIPKPETNPARINVVKFGVQPVLPYAIEEAVNRLRINISFLGSDVKKIMVVSSEPNEGKSFVAMNLWKQMARAGESTVLLDLDMRKSTMAVKYQMSREDGQELLGTSHYLAGDIPIEDMILHTDMPTGDILPNVDNIVNPSMLFESRKFTEMMRYTQDNYRYIFVDVPPLGLVSDGELIGSVCDGAVLCVRGGVTSRGIVRRSIQQLERAGCPVLGIVLNRVGGSGSGYYHKYYGKKYYYNDQYYSKG